MSHFRSKGFTLIELLIVVAIIGILAAIAIPNFLEAQIRAKVARVNSDLRNIATAVEMYKVDTDEYPAFSQEVSPILTLAYQGTINYPDNGYFWWLWTFVIRTDTRLIETLTTPIEYLTSFPVDPFGNVVTPGVGPYGYWTVGAAVNRQQTAYILFSFGPDLSYQLNRAGDFRYRVYNPVSCRDCGILNPKGGNPTPQLLHGISTHGDYFVEGCFTYDATNGTMSKGDVWRVGP